MPSVYGMNDAQLLSIINATRDAIDRMNKVNGDVQSQAGTYTQTNNSDSGKIMQDRLITWNGEFTGLVSDLDNLNTKVTNVRANNNDTSGAASGAAGHQS